MAWTSMHFAVGMACAGGATLLLGAITRRGFRAIPLTMTLGGIWAIAPDLPRIFREDLPWLPYAATLGSKSFERTMHAWGDLFFFHGRLDAQPHEYALHGFLAVLVLYNLAIFGLLWDSHLQRNSPLNALVNSYERLVRRRGGRDADRTPLDAKIEAARIRRRQDVA